MSKNIWHVLPCGRMYRFKEYNYEDVSSKLVDYIWKRIPKEELNKLVPMLSQHPSRKRWTHRFYTAFMRAFLKQLVDELMESNRVIINDKMMLFIGKIQDDPDRIVKKHKHKVSFEEDDSRFAVVLAGVDHSYYFRLRSDRRKELHLRLEKGQNFHGYAPKTVSERR